MATKVFVNLPVADLERSRAFFEALGYQFNEQFSNEKGACLVIDENFFAMLLTHELFTSFAPHKAIALKSASEVMVAFDMPTAGPCATSPRGPSRWVRRTCGNRRSSASW